MSLLLTMLCSRVHDALPVYRCSPSLSLRLDTQPTVSLLLPKMLGSQLHNAVPVFYCRPSLLPSGSTGAMCIIRPPTNQGGKYKIHVINVGDSRVLLSKADGTMIGGPGTDGGLTTDHKPDHPSERERIYRTGGTVEVAMGGVHRVNGDLAVSRCFGDADYKRTGGPGLEDHPVTANPEMGHFECNGSDFILVVCDGVSEEEEELDLVSSVSLLVKSLSRWPERTWLAIAQGVAIPTSNTMDDNNEEDSTTIMFTCGNAFGKTCHLT